ncbi:MAG: hypothetical protein COB02_04855 [Candidatus Cloacimonadota bacterium]|nr:MAG: hypothetical protein COB02_04855 [Candidatus Cloacimonadota bacterium]
MKNYHKKNNHGIALPLVLGAVSMMFILIITMMFTTSATYSQMSIVANNTQARMLSRAVVEEITQIMHERLSDPLRPRVWKVPLLSKVFEFKDYTVTFDPNELETLKILNGKDFKNTINPGGFQGGERIVPIVNNEGKTALRAEIIKAEVKFHNFSYMLFSSFPKYNNPNNYYRDVLNRQGGQVPRGDFYGFATIFVRMKYGLVEKDYYVTKDIKVTNNEPIGKNYVAFFGGSPPTTVGNMDLNTPGKFEISAREKGRILMMGPYFLDVEGNPDGTGGAASKRTFSNGWDSLAFMPSPRGIQICDSILSTGIERPDKKSGNMGISIGIGGSGCLGVVMSGDAGYKGNPEFQDYWAAGIEKGKQNFTITGPPGQFNLWQGLLFKEDSDGGKSTGKKGESVSGTADSEIPVGEFNTIAGIPSGHEGRVEGTLVGNYSHISYKKHHTCSTLMDVFSAFGDIGSSLGGLFGSSGGTKTDGGATTENSSSLPNLNSPERSSELFNCNDLKHEFQDYQSNFYLSELPLPIFQDSFSKLSQISNEIALITSMIEVLNCKGNDFLNSFFNFNFLPKIAEGDTTTTNDNTTSTDDKKGGFFGDGIGDTSWGEIGTGIGNSLQVCLHFYKVTANKGFQAMYALHSGYAAEINKAEMILGELNDVMQGFSKAGSQKSGGLLGGIKGSLDNIKANAEIAAGKKNTLSGGFNQSGLLKPSMLGRLPSNFKLYTRTAARRYPTITDYFKDVSKKKNDRIVFFDGNIWLDELEEDKAITYVGSGSIVINHIKGSSIFPSKQTVRISNVLPLEGNNKDHHINIVYNNDHSPEQGEGMLELKGTVMGSVFSTQGVRPIGNAMIEGNITGFYVNKAKFEDSNILRVVYNPNLQGTNKKTPYQHFTVSISPKISGYATTIKAFEGEGDDGVLNIVDSLDDIPPTNTTPTQLPPQPSLTLPQNNTTPQVNATPTPASETN